MRELFRNKVHGVHVSWGLVAARLEEVRKKQAKAREQNKTKCEAAKEFVSALSLVMSRDRALLHREKTKWQKAKELAEKQIAHIEAVIRKTRMEYCLVGCSDGTTFCLARCSTTLKNCRKKVLDNGTSLIRTSPGMPEMICKIAPS